VGFVFLHVACQGGRFSPLLPVSYATSTVAMIALKEVLFTTTYHYEAGFSSLMKLNQNMETDWMRNKTFD